jgi:hypothetical protein
VRSIARGLSKTKNAEVLIHEQATKKRTGHRRRSGSPHRGFDGLHDDEIIGFVITNAGLMGSASLNGSRITRLNL